jgi:hypothetical protein
MKVKTNIHAGKRSGTMLSNSDLGISGGNGGTEVEAPSPAPAPIIYTGRCVGI